ncbi:MAG: RidA family protein [Bryobacteraceae bacterium]
MIERLSPPGVPSPRGPYSPAVRAGDFLFVSGQGPVDAEDRVSKGDIRHETRLVLENIRRILEGCGSSMAEVVRCTVYMTDVGEFAAMNEVYGEYFGEQKPARTTVQVARLPFDIRVEIDAIAYRPPGEARGVLSS